MRKTLLWCSALLLSITMLFSCSIAGKVPDENARSGVDKLESLQNAFKGELKEAIARMSDNAEPLLSSVLFMDDDVVSDYLNNDVLTVKYIYSRISYQEMLDNWQDTKSIVLEDWL